jgi:glycosyltransferase involved in cell wall biosynthesis
MSKISIIIPIYNIEKYLRQALDSVVNQTLDDIEIICIDDCSTDNSLAIVKEYAQKDDRFVIIEQKENQGQGVARNIGIERASSKYIMFLDPDDYYELNACEEAFNQIEKFGNDIVFFNYNTLQNRGNFESARYKNVLKNLEYCQKLTPKNDKIPYMGYCWTKIYNKDFLIQNDCKFTQTRCGEDVPFAVKSTINANSVSVLNKSLYNYRIFFKKDNFRNKTMCNRFKNFEEPLKNREIAYKLVMFAENINEFKTVFLIYYTRILIKIFNEYTPNVNYECKNDILRTTQYLLKQVMQENNLEQIPEINIENLNKFLSYENYYQYWFKIVFLQQIFSIKNKYKDNCKYKIITFLGVKITFKVKNKSQTLARVERERERERERE